MKREMRVLSVLIWGPGLTMLLGVGAAGQTQPATTKSYEKLIYSVKGPDLFHAYCAACHGVEGRGDGPAAAALKTKPANLTLLAKNNGGKFPVEQVQKFISGDDPSLQSHGSREMPVWVRSFTRSKTTRISAMFACRT